MTKFNFLESIIVINIKIFVSLVPIFLVQYLPSIVADKVPFGNYRCVHLKFIIGKSEAKKQIEKLC
jgi:hypothetical protein